MRRIAFLLVCIAVLLTFTGCHSDTSDVNLKSGSYYAVGDYEKFSIPYLSLNMEDDSFVFGPGSVFSYIEHGYFKIKDHKLIATSQSTTFVFDIHDENTLILIESGEEEITWLPDNAEFMYSEELK